MHFMRRDVLVIGARFYVAATVGLLMLVLSPYRVAHAALGDDVASIERDHAALRGTIAIVPMQSYDVHQMTNESGTTVREYASRAGKVFAVTWSGARVPDLKQLLGVYFDRYVTAARAHRTGHHVLSVDTPELSVKVVRFQRMSNGQVLVPALLPSGVTRHELN